ncbi:hypothetical protein PHISP_01672 [Aspergillus sp. HF37]|nr:hypothetical protein PHISP_01672 [Aspergillus sp. HF37]
MISPHKSPPKNSANGSPRTAAPLRGLFLDGIWRCNCPGRPPAIQFQTKNQGVNHGRWFYTCQQPKGKQCNFFLWASDAEARAKLVVLASSTSELDAAAAQSRTPAKPAKYQNGLPTPATERRTSDSAAKMPGGKTASSQTQLPYKSAKARKMMAEDSPDTEPFDWDEDLDEQLASSFEDRPSPSPPARPRQPDFGQPRTPTRSSPGKRKLSVFEEDSGSTTASGTVRGDSGGGVFTPQASQEQWFPPLSAEVSMTPTPSRYTNALSADSGSPGDISELAGQALKLLEGQGVIVPRRAQNDLVSLLNTFDLKMKAISRGRDITREALKKRDEQIMRQNERIQSLESQRELDRAMINGLKNNLP